MKAKEEYYKIGSVPCPAFNNELVYFNKYGFNHLIRKGKYPRDRKEQLKRILILPYSLSIIKNSKYVSEYRINNIKNVCGYFWSVQGNINGFFLRVVIRQINSGSKHFFSIMYEKQKAP